MVIGAGDGDGDGLSVGGRVGGAGVIGGDDAVGQRDGLVGGKEVEVDGGVVGPAVLRGVDGEAIDQSIDFGGGQLVGEGASGPGDAGVGFADGDGISGIELREGEGAGVGESGVEVSFCGGASGCDGIDDGLVIGAGDGEGDLIGCGSALWIGGGDGVAEGDGFTVGEEVEVCAVEVVGPGGGSRCARIVGAC